MYSDLGQWLKQRKKSNSEIASPISDFGEVSPSVKKVKLSYKEKKLAETIEKDIEKAEKELADAQKTLEDPAVFSSRDKTAETLKKVEIAQKSVDKLYSAWQNLEAKMKG